MSAVLDADTTVPQALLSPEAENDVRAAADLIKAGVDPLPVLRTLYSLARMNGLLEMARI